MAPSAPSGCGVIGGKKFRRTKLTRKACAPAFAAPIIPDDAAVTGYLKM
jgi:hypothetical protein